MVAPRFPTPALPSHWALQAGRRRGGFAVMLGRKEWAAGSEAKESRTSSSMPGAPITGPPGHTHPRGQPSLPGSGSASPRSSAPGPRPASPVPLLALFCSSGPRPPTGQEPLPEAGGPNLTHSNPGAEQEVSGELMLASFPVHPRSCHPCRGQIKRQDRPLSQPAAGWPGLELHVPRCTAPYPHTNTHRFPKA